MLLLTAFFFSRQFNFLHFSLFLSWDRENRQQNPYRNAPLEHSRLFSFFFFPFDFKSRDCVKAAAGDQGLSEKRGSFPSSHLLPCCVLLQRLRAAAPSIFLPYFARYPWEWGGWGGDWPRASQCAARSIAALWVRDQSPADTLPFGNCCHREQFREPAHGA